MCTRYDFRRTTCIPAHFKKEKYKCDDHYYSVPALASKIKQFPVMQLEITKVLWELDEMEWDDGVEGPIPARRVVLEKRLHSDDYQRVLKADLSWPIWVREEMFPDGSRLAIVNGRHRLAKAMIAGWTTIPAIFIDAATMNACEVKVKPLN